MESLIGSWAVENADLTFALENATLALSAIHFHQAGTDPQEVKTCLTFQSLWRMTTGDRRAS